jgi:predicted nucleotidyltransferase
VGLGDRRESRDARAPHARLIADTLVIERRAHAARSSRRGRNGIFGADLGTPRPPATSEAREISGRRPIRRWKTPI